jgi:hypothetical protein
MTHKAMGTSSWFLVEPGNEQTEDIEVISLSSKDRGRTHVIRLRILLGYET